MQINLYFYIMLEHMSPTVHIISYYHKKNINYWLSDLDLINKLIRTIDTWSYRPVSIILITPRYTEVIITYYQSFGESIRELTKFVIQYRIEHSDGNSNQEPITLYNKYVIVVQLYIN